MALDKADSDQAQTLHKAWKDKYFETFQRKVSNSTATFFLAPLFRCHDFTNFP
jgi:hypothetical protein